MRAFGQAAKVAALFYFFVSLSLSHSLSLTLSRSLTLSHSLFLSLSFSLALSLSFTPSLSWPLMPWAGLEHGSPAWHTRTLPLSYSLLLGVGPINWDRIDQCYNQSITILFCVQSALYPHQDENYPRKMKSILAGWKLSSQDGNYPHRMDIILAGWKLSLPDGNNPCRMHEKLWNAKLCSIIAILMRVKIRHSGKISFVHVLCCYQSYGQR